MRKTTNAMMDFSEEVWLGLGLGLGFGVWVWG